MRNAFRDVAEFHEAANLPLSTKPPEVPDYEVILLRERLVTEEYDELMEALEEVHYEPCNGGIASVADAIADLIYVLTGTAIAFGIDLPEIWRRVHAANMAKFGPGSWKRADGKQMKPPTWGPPDIEGALRDQKPLAETYGKEKT